MNEPYPVTRFPESTTARGAPTLPARAIGLVVALAVASMAACSASGVGTGGLAPPGVMESTLPPVPSVSGPVRLYVEYPDSLQRIAVSDTNFIFGTVGTGDATLVIDGQLVDVEPNGAFLAWLPVPRATRGDTAWYRLVATRAGQVDSIRHPVLLPTPPYEGPAGVAWIDSASVTPRPERWMLPDDMVELSFRGAPGMEAWLEARSGRLPAPEGPTPGRYEVRLPAARFHAAACTADACDWIGETVRLTATFALWSGEDTARADLEVPLRLLDPARLPIVELREPPDTVNGTNGMVVGRTWQLGTYRWRFPVRTRAEVDARDGDRYRLRLAPDLGAWVAEEDAVPAPPDTPPPRSRVGDLSFRVRADRVELAIPLAAALPLQVEEPDAHTIVLTLFGAIGDTDRVTKGAGSRVVRDVAWMQLPGERYRLEIRLAEPVWGFRTTYRSLEGDAAELLLEIRRMPAIDRDEPLAGRRVAIDPGHPGAGATGPTGYYEGHANLAIGLILERLLRKAGADPVLLRRDTLPMGLYERTAAAIAAGAELYVSIHNNALPDGIQPVGREGTSTYYFHPHSRALAEAIHEGMLSTMRLRDLGAYWGNLAVCRMAWMPSVLTEGAFMMIPSHEAALMDEGFQELYARGVLIGIRDFLGSAARAGEAGGRWEGSGR